MKKIVVLLIIICAAGAAIYYKVYILDAPKKVSVTITDVQSESQPDAEVDTETAKDTFEYFLSSVGETSLSKVKEKFQRFNAQRAEHEKIDERLFEQYVKYREFLKTIDGNAEQQQLQLEELRNVDEQLLSAQAMFFTQEEQQQLFAEENRLRELTLRKLELRSQTTDNVEFNMLWQQELQSLPMEDQESYRRASLLRTLGDASEMDDQERYLQKEALLGAEIAQRLSKLERSQQTFSNNVDNYMLERNNIMLDDKLDQNDKVRAIDDLREASFSGIQQKRVKGLERIADAKK